MAGTRPSTDAGSMTIQLIPWVDRSLNLADLFGRILSTIVDGQFNAEFTAFAFTASDISMVKALVMWLMKRPYFASGASAAGSSAAGAQHGGFSSRFFSTVFQQGRGQQVGRLSRRKPAPSTLQQKWIVSCSYSLLIFLLFSRSKPGNGSRMQTISWLYP